MKHAPDCKCEHQFIDSRCHKLRHKPQAEKPKRLTIGEYHLGNGEYGACVYLDDCEVFDTNESTEPEARAAAQAYVDALLAHFREGGE